MKKFIALAVTFFSLIVGVANADVTQQYMGFNCSLTSFKVTIVSGYMVYKAGTSCGGSEVNYEKQIDYVELYDATTSTVIDSIGASGWKTSNPVQESQSSDPVHCTSGHTYQVISGGEVKHNTSLAQITNLYSDGYVCP
jgi:hypothetical protein